MKKTLALLAATTAICAGISAPVWSTIRADSTGDHAFAAMFEGGRNAVQVILASSRDDDDDDHEYRSGSRERHDDDDNDDDDEECEDDDGDDDDCLSNISNAAPAGTVEPPKNGLFGPGAAPKVEVK